MNVFAYCGALQGRNIRLLKVIPGAQLSTLVIELVERSLDGAEFEALSYVWGAKVGKKTIQCNGKWLNIGANLHAALHERRRRKSTGFLWADQICINQYDVQEKTHQVRLMRDIYARANRVIIWLGEQRPEDSDGFRLANNLYKKCDGRRYGADGDIYDFHDFDCVSRGIPDPLFNPTWVALFKIINNPWFGRVWIIQELLVAQRSVMWKGSLDMDTNIILWSATLIGRHRNLYNSYNITMDSPQTSALMARNIATSYFQFKKSGPIPLYDTLSRQSGMGATDLRDRFFALAGVSSGLDKAFVNYTKTIREVACLVGKMTLLGFPNYKLTEDGAEVLVLEHNWKEHRFPIEWLAFHANPQNHELDIPSWVPDLLSPHSPGLLMTGFYNSSYLQDWRDVPNPQVRFKEQRYLKGESSLDYWQITVPEVRNNSCLRIP